MSASYRVPVYPGHPQTALEARLMRPLGTVLAPEPCFRELHFASGVVLQLGMRIEDGEKVDPYNFTVLKRLVFVFGGDPADLATIPSFEPHKEATK